MIKLTKRSDYRLLRCVSNGSILIRSTKMSLVSRSGVVHTFCSPPEEGTLGIGRFAGGRCGLVLVVVAT